MDQRFEKLVDALHPSFLKLTDCPPITDSKSLPKKGVYLFSEKGKHLYVGRSNNIPNRSRAHRSLSSGENSAAFAFILASEAIGRPKPNYKPDGSRKALMRDPTFREAFDAAKQRIRTMEFRAVAEDDQILQALLEVYCAVALDTPYNDFGTH